MHLDLRDLDDERLFYYDVTEGKLFPFMSQCSRLSDCYDPFSKEGLVVEVEIKKDANRFVDGAFCKYSRFQMERQPYFC